jgi:hypothetical protein
MQTADTIPTMDTTMRVSVETRDALVELCKKNEPYDIVIKKLIVHWKKTHTDQ